MTPRLRSLPLLITCSLVAFLLGSVGTAVAAPALTEKTVARIAAEIAGKVVKKKAKSLSVRNAARLDGRPASAYRDEATLFSVDIASTSASHEITVPLGPGHYQIAYSAYLAGGSATSLCLIERDRGGSSLFTADQGFVGFGPSMSAIGVIDVRPGDVVTLSCSSGTAWNTSSSEPIQIVATPLDAVTAVPIAVS